MGSHSIRILGGTPLLTWRLALLLSGCPSAIRFQQHRLLSCTSSTRVVPGQPLHTSESESLVVPRLVRWWHKAQRTRAHQHLTATARHTPDAEYHSTPRRVAHCIGSADHSHRTPGHPHRVTTRSPLCFSNQGGQEMPTPRPTMPSVAVSCREVWSDQSRADVLPSPDR